MRPMTMLALLSPLIAAAPAAGGGSTRVVTFEGQVSGEEVLIPRFDPELGQLERVHVTLQLEVQGGLGFENVSPGRNMVSASFGAYARVLAPGGAQLAEAVTFPIECDHVLAPFDGTLDLAGSSGIAFAGLSSDAIAQRTWQADPLWVAGLVASKGPIALTVETTDTTQVVGSGPLVVRRAQSTTAVLFVGYEYTPLED